MPRGARQGAPRRPARGSSHQESQVDVALKIDRIRVLQAGEDDAQVFVDKDKKQQIQSGRDQVSS